MTDRPPFAEAVGASVIHSDPLDVVVVVVGEDSEFEAAVTAAKAADEVPYDVFGGLWHIGDDGRGRSGISFHSSSGGAATSGSSACGASTTRRAVWSTRSARSHTSSPCSQPDTPGRRTSPRRTPGLG